jgi:hypothetical protein
MEKVLLLLILILTGVNCLCLITLLSNLSTLGFIDFGHGCATGGD